MKNLKNTTIRAGIINTTARAIGMLLRIASLMVLGRLLDPSDYGLVSMVTAFTGVLNMVGSFGLFQAAIQRDNLTTEQASTLFWVNVVLGALLTLAAIALAPAVSIFYREPRLLAITAVVALGFVITGAGVQHGVLLQRNMRFGTSALIEITSLLIGTSISIGMALFGYGYWAVVSTTITLPLSTTVGLWFATGWIPGPPRRRIGLRSLVHFGGTMTLNGFVSYVANNFDKLILGRFWGAETIGIYGRAYHLIMFPSDNLNSSIGEVAFAALSRAKEDRQLLKRYFLKGYSLIVAATIPITVACALFADDLIAVILGPKWGEAAVIFRILAPTIAVFSVSNPLGWLLNSLGLVRRGLHIALVSAPLIIGAISAGLPYGPRGIATAYSAIMLLKVVPITMWAVHGTNIRASEIFLALGRPLAASLLAAAIVLGAHFLYGPILPLFPRLLLDLALFGSIYLVALLCIAGQSSVYLDVLRMARVVPSA